jgi:hypothetical protein
VLRVDGELDRLGLAQVVPIPCGVEQSETQASAKDRVDHLALAPTDAGRARLHRPAHIVIVRERRGNSSPYTA